VLVVTEDMRYESANTNIVTKLLEVRVINTTYYAATSESLLANCRHPLTIVASRRLLAGSGRRINSWRRNKPQERTTKARLAQLRRVAI
jgi:hypothetical protein